MEKMLTETFARAVEYGGLMLLNSVRRDRKAMLRARNAGLRSRHLPKRHDSNQEYSAPDIILSK